jgi:hypothetical protein
VPHFHPQYCQWSRNPCSSFTIFFTKHYIPLCIPFKIREGQQWVLPCLNSYLFNSIFNCPHEYVERIYLKHYGDELEFSGLQSYRGWLNCPPSDWNRLGLWADTCRLATRANWAPYIQADVYKSRAGATAYSRTRPRCLPRPRRPAGMLVFEAKPQDFASHLYDARIIGMRFGVLPSRSQCVRHVTSRSHTQSNDCIQHIIALSAISVRDKTFIAIIRLERGMRNDYGGHMSLCDAIRRVHMTEGKYLFTNASMR